DRDRAQSAEVAADRERGAGAEARREHGDDARRDRADEQRAGPAAATAAVEPMAPLAAGLEEITQVAVVGRHGWTVGVARSRGTANCRGRSGGARPPRPRGSGRPRPTAAARSLRRPRAR